MLFEDNRELLRARFRSIALFLRDVADRLDEDGLPMITNNTPGWGDIILATDTAAIRGEPTRTISPVLEVLDGHVRVVVGPNGISNCKAVIVLPAPGKTISVATEEAR